MVEKPAGHGAAGGPEAAAKERKGLWSPEEDERLYARITRHGVSTWSSVAQLAGLRRSGKSCRLRWMNYLRPDLKKEPISKREKETIVSLQKSLGNRWSVIAARMPGRTDNEIKNYWNSRIRKRQSVATIISSGDGAGANGDPPAAAETHELAVAAAPAGEQKEPFAVPPARFPVFACQLPAGGGAGDAIAAAAAATQSTTTTTHEHNGAGSESEVSVCGGVGGDEHYYYYRAGDGDMDMIGHLLSFDDFEYPAAAAGGDLLLDAWDSQLYCANSGGSSVD